MRYKRGNSHRKARNRKSQRLPEVQPLEVVRLTLHERDPITGNEDTLYTLFYENYRGYTIYSTEQGRCCIHSGRQGCLRIGGKYVGFPDVEEAKTMIKRFLAHGRTAQESMDRSVPEEEYLCLNSTSPHRNRVCSSRAGAEYP